MKFGIQLRKLRLSPLHPRTPNKHWRHTVPSWAFFPPCSRLSHYLFHSVHATFIFEGIRVLISVETSASTWLHVLGIVNAQQTGTKMRHNFSAPSYVVVPSPCPFFFFLSAHDVKTFKYSRKLSPVRHLFTDIVLELVPDSNARLGYSKPQGIQRAAFEAICSGSSFALPNPSCRPSSRWKPFP